MRRAFLSQLVRGAPPAGPTVFELRPGPNVVGRSASCDVVLDDDAAGREHSRLTLSDEGVLVEDLGSAGGTWLLRATGENARVGRPTALEHGDVLVYPRVRLLFTLDQPATDVPPFIAMRYGTVPPPPLEDPPGPIPSSSAAPVTAAAPAADEAPRPAARARWTMDAESRELLAAAAARPEDVGPRLVVADRLSERGDPFGEFLALWAGAKDGRLRGLAVARERELRRLHSAAWRPPGTAGGETWTHGLLSGVTWEAPTDAQHPGWCMVRDLRCGPTSYEARPERTPFGEPRPALQRVHHLKSMHLAAFAALQAPTLLEVGLDLSLSAFVLELLPALARFPPTQRLVLEQSVAPHASRLPSLLPTLSLLLRGSVEVVVLEAPEDLQLALPNLGVRFELRDSHRWRGAPD